MTKDRSRLFIALIHLYWLHLTLGDDNGGGVKYLPGSLNNNSIMTTGQAPFSTKVLTIEEFDSFSRQSGGNGNSSAGTATTTKQGPCQCANGVCGCCSRFLLETWRQKACVNVTYDPDEFSFTTNIWMNDRVLYTRTVSGKNPRPVCIPVPRIPVVRACVRFYNIYFQGRNVHVCISMEGKFQDTTLFKVGLDCVRLGANGVALVTPEDGGGLGQVEFLPEDVSGNTADDSEEDYDDDDDDDDDDYF